MSAPALHLVLVTPEIPANTGNIVRLCAATGVWLHLVEPLGFRLDDRVLKRAGLDYWDACHLERHLDFEAFERAHPEAACHFLSARAEPSLFACALPPRAALVLGPESSGLSARFLDVPGRRQRSLRIPMPGQGRSLNLSTAAGIVVYEALRQQGLLGPTGGR
ncbi:MAG TPA: tRNA (cytidine(34)-2'-O)-methyltransferase [Myxococcota bacterium]|nr:tRNA (cytidine(34)-2'-O)-methyltransferase [Myxococcota bacterium]HRY96318.1 tRNA (cytidine(34)-2'-O)-methyltransferase [Myxococcota bacterium]HSA20800.1 tRNA (cytidine(34)-2'-O)-methyltransferase [Myxococcota bacterium]